MRNWADKDEVLALLQSGDWELGYSDGIRSAGRYWMQKGGLRKGGETRDVRAVTAYSLLKRNVIERLPRSEGDPYWLQRYRLVVNGQPTEPAAGSALAQLRTR